MFHDLDVCVPRSARKSTLETLQRLGYDVVAFTTTKSGGKLTDGDVPVRDNYDDLKEVQPTILHPDHAKRRRGITVLERITLNIERSSDFAIFSCPQLAQFDIVAARPATDQLFQQCMQFDFDILCLPIEKHFPIKRQHLHQVEERGMFFEIPYAFGLRDALSRRNLITRSCSVSGVTKGKRLVLSSSAQKPMELRAPLDVINLGTLLGIPQQYARDSVIANPEGAVTHGDVRARAHKGIVRVEEVKNKPKVKGGNAFD